MHEASKYLTLLIWAVIMMLAGSACGGSDKTAAVPTTTVPTTTTESVPAEEEGPSEAVTETPAPVEVEVPTPTLPAVNPKLVLDPVLVGPGESACAVAGLNYLDRVQLNFEFVGSQPLSSVAVDYRLTVDGVSSDDVSFLGYVQEAEQVRILDETSHRADPNMSLDDIACEVLGVRATPMADQLPITATCASGQLDANDRLNVVISVDATNPTGLSEYSLVGFSLALYDSNGVRISRSFPEVVLPAGGESVELNRRTWVPVGSPINLSDYELSCEAFAFSIVESLVAAAPGSSCVFNGVDGFNDLTGVVESPISESADVWMAIIGPDGTWVGTTDAYVFPGEMSFATVTQVPQGLSASDLECRIVGVEQ